MCLDERTTQRDNFNALATIEDNDSCIYADDAETATPTVSTTPMMLMVSVTNVEVLGCDDPIACNFNSSATDNDGS